MKRVHRLQNADIRQIFSVGRRFSSPLFRVVYRRTAGPHARFAFVAPRTVDKRAVVRNRLRRRARERARLHKKLIQTPVDVVLTFTKEARDAPRKKMYEELDEFYGKISRE